MLGISRTLKIESNALPNQSIGVYANFDKPADGVGGEGMDVD